MSYNSITVVGNVGMKPDFRKVGDREVCNFTIAVNRKVKDEKVTVWFTCVSWDDRKNKIIDDYVKKGDQVMIVGELRPREYTDKQGQDRTALDVDISFNGSLVLLNNQREDEGSSRSSRGRDEPKRETRAAPARDRRDDLIDDDIPF